MWKDEAEVIEVSIITWVHLVPTSHVCSMCEAGNNRMRFAPLGGEVRIVADEADERLVGYFIAVLVVLVSQALMPAADAVHAQEVAEVEECKVETVTRQTPAGELRERHRLLRCRQEEQGGQINRIKKGIADTLTQTGQVSRIELVTFRQRGDIRENACRQCATEMESVQEAPTAACQHSFNMFG